jgi:hypothetical protein
VAASAGRYAAPAVAQQRRRARQQQPRAQQQQQQQQQRQQQRQRRRPRQRKRLERYCTRRNRWTSESGRIPSLLLSTHARSMR